ncbi:hypothetical protein XH96_17730 [Bradyrhizobium sp. CCBAU 51765]|nr:hypothetical protein XH96_17730 [Bradyrhizobium sp. CCBAU 51765]
MAGGARGKERGGSYPLICRRGRRDVILSVMPGLVPPARPKPLRRGEGPGIHALLSHLTQKNVDGRDKP